MKRAVLLLLFAPSLFAQHQYIIPMVGSAPGIDADHYAGASILNPTARTAHIRVTGVYPVFGPPQCNVQVPQELVPRGREGIVFPVNCPGRPLAAVSIESDEPLVVKTFITSFLRRFDVQIHDVQQIDAGTAWVPIGVEALTSGEFDEEHGLRANLLLINPNAYALRVRIEVNRPEAGVPARVETLVVAPQTTILHPLAAVPVPPQPFPTIVTGHHDVLLSADGPFWAGVSSLTTNGGNHFQEAVALEP
jgi:hypothetical protein